MNDKTIQRLWLSMFFFSIFISIVRIFLENYFDSETKTYSSYRILANLMNILIFTLPSSYFVIKKAATSSLTFYIILTSFSIIYNVVFYLNDHFQNLPLCIPYFKWFFWGTQISGLLWIKLCWEMRKINKKRKNLTSQPS